jgi:hypothetical protein
MKTKEKTLINSKKEIKRIKDIQDLNKAFEKASPDEKRIIIAKDVIAQLKLKKFIAQTGVYFDAIPESNQNNLLDWYDKFKEKSIKNIINEEEVSCKVCGIGGVFASCVRITNNISTSKFKTGSQNDQTIVRKFLKKYFDIDQLRLIESAFEMSDFDDSNSLGELVQVSIRFGKQFNLSSNKRLVAIMKNIIRNKGTFKLKFNKKTGKYI